MDFKRTQLLLLVFFVIFDIYLALTLVGKLNVKMIDSNHSTTINIEQQLKSRNVKFKQVLENNSVSLPIVKVEQNQELAQKKDSLQQQSVKMANDQLVSVFDSPLDVGLTSLTESNTLTDEQIEALRQNFLGKSELFIHGLDYPIWSYNAETRVLTLYMAGNDGRPIVDGSAELRLTFTPEFLLRDYTQTYQSERTTLDSSKELISARDALKLLEKRVDTYIPDGATIEQVNLGYYRTMNLKEIAIYSPVWEIVYRQDETTLRTVLVDAIDKQIVTRPTATTPN